MSSSRTAYYFIWPSHPGCFCFVLLHKPPPRSTLSLLNAKAFCVYKKDNIPPCLPCTYSENKGDVGTVWDEASHSKLQFSPYQCPSAQMPTSDLPASEASRVRLVR